MLDLAFVEEYYYDFVLTRLQERRSPRDTTLDVGFEHSLRDRHLFLSGKVRNLTNAETYTELNRPLPGINWAVKLRVIF
jgi:putative mxcH